MGQCSLSEAKMKGFLCQVAVLLALISVGLSVKIKQQCDLSLEVFCPDEVGEEPSVACATSCATSTKNTFLIHALYKTVDCLTEFDKMVKVEYSKSGDISCSLVPLQTDTELLDASLSKALDC